MTVLKLFFLVDDYIYAIRVREKKKCTNILSQNQKGKYERKFMKRKKKKVHFMWCVKKTREFFFVLLLLLVCINKNMMRRERESKSNDKQNRTIFSGFW